MTVPYPLSLNLFLTVILTLCVYSLQQCLPPRPKNLRMVPRHTPPSHPSTPSKTLWPFRRPLALPPTPTISTPSTSAPTPGTTTTLAAPLPNPVPVPQSVLSTTHCTSVGVQMN